MRSSPLVFVAMLFVATIHVPPGHAQEDGGIHLIPRVGRQQVVAGFVLRAIEFPEAGAGEFVANVGAPVELSDGWLAGVGIEMDLPVRWLAFRASVDRTVGADLVQVPTGSCGDECFSIAPGPGQEVGGVTRWSLATDVVFQPVPGG